MAAPVDDAEEGNGAWSGADEARGRRARVRGERLTRRRRRRFGFRDRGRRDGRKRRRDVEGFRFERCEVRDTGRDGRAGARRDGDDDVVRIDIRRRRCITTLAISSKRIGSRRRRRARG